MKLEVKEKLLLNGDPAFLEFAQKEEQKLDECT